MAQHPWQRRSLSLMLVVIFCCGTVFVCYPYVQDYMLLGRLGSPDKTVREAAVKQAIVMVQQFPHTEKSLNRALEDSDDTTFKSVVVVLNKLKKFNVPGRNIEQIDRYNALSALESPPMTRLYLLRNLLLCDRDNVYIRRVAMGAVKDSWAEVRCLGAVLAASLGEDDALKTALRDEDPTVQSWAAMSAGLADRKATEELVSQLFNDRCKMATTHLAARGAGVPPACGEAILASPDKVATTNTSGNGKDATGTVAAHAGKMPATHEGGTPSTHAGETPATHEAGTASAPAMSPVEADREVISAAALALARFDAPKYAGAIARQASATPDAKLRERLLHVLAQADKKVAAPLVAAMLEQAKDSPSPALLLAAGKLGVVQAEAPIRKILRDVVLPDKPQPVALVRAAIQAGGELRLALEPELMEYCGKLWYPVEEPSLMAAAMLLGEQPPDQSGQYPKARKLMLDGGANRVVKGPPDETGQPQEYYTPFASAAAAVALWQMKVEKEDQVIKDAVDFAPRARLVAHYVAWRLVSIDPDRAYKLALTMLPPPGAPFDQREDRERVRSCGAMMLALSARTPERKAQTIERIRSRIEDESDFYVRGSYKSALLILGQKEFLETVGSMFEMEGYPRRETMLALSAAGDRRALDGLLWNISDDQLAEVLMNQNCLDVLNAVHGLPKIDEAAFGDLLNWQMRIVRCGYALNRSRPLKVDYQSPADTYTK